MVQRTSAPPGRGSARSTTITGRPDAAAPAIPGSPSLLNRRSPRRSIIAPPNSLTKAENEHARAAGRAKNPDRVLSPAALVTSIDATVFYIVFAAIIGENSRLFGFQLDNLLGSVEKR